MAEKLIYLIRHGEYERDLKAGRRGPGLTDTGREQARLTAAALAAEPVRAIHCSTLTRAEETAAIIAARFPALRITRTPVLREALPCVPTRFAQTEREGITYHDARQRLRGDPEFRGELERALAARVNVEPDRYSQDRAQADRAFERFFRFSGRSDRQEALVCHGNLIRYFVCRVLRIDPAGWGDMDTWQCGITRVVIQRTGLMYLLSFNDGGHLPRALRMF